MVFKYQNMWLRTVPFQQNFHNHSDLSLYDPPLDLPTIFPCKGLNGWSLLYFSCSFSRNNTQRWWKSYRLLLRISIYNLCLFLSWTCNVLVVHLLKNAFDSSSHREWTERSLPNEVHSPNVTRTMLICLHCYQLLWISPFWGSHTRRYPRQFWWWSWNSI